jgi:hypothetical protein
MTRPQLFGGDLFVALGPNPAVNSDAPVKDFVLVDVLVVAPVSVVR